MQCVYIVGATDGSLVFNVLTLLDVVGGNVKIPMSETARVIDINVAKTRYETMIKVLEIKCKIEVTENKYSKQAQNVLSNIQILCVE